MFERYLLSTSTRLSIPIPSCQCADELYTLVSTRGIVEGFVSFCSLQGLSSKSTSGYIDGSKFYAARLDGAPVIPSGLIISRLLEGLANLSKPPSAKKLGINSGLVRRMVAELPLMALSSYERSLWRVLLHFGVNSRDSRGFCLFLFLARSVV